MLITRRQFIKRTAAAGAAIGFGAFGRFAPAGEKDAASANEDIRIACIGTRGKGKAHMSGLESVPGAKVVALCDVDESILGARADQMEKRTGRKLKRFGDYRKLLDDKQIDAVSIATPNHTHCLIAITAMQSGKDVYVEKPCSHNIWEGRQLVAAARKYKRMCQHGTQGRSSPAIEEGIRKVQEGLIGDVYMARGICYKWRPSIGHTPNEPVPPGVDYDLWLGPAPQRPFSRNRFHYNWHLSSALCHLGNISYRLGRTVNFDPKTETFPGDEKASAMLSRNYREPYVVPKIG